MNKQNGFATLEIILIIGIIAIFSTVAVPKMARLVDKANLNYEMKHLYSDLNFARDLNKSSKFDAGIFTTIHNPDGKIEFWIYVDSYITPSARNHYQIMRTALTSSPFFRHNLSNEIKLSSNISGGYNKPIKIDYDNLGKSTQTFTLTSKFGNESYVYLNTVGRIRGSYVKE